MIDEEKVYAVIGKRIREERRKLDWTQEQLSEKVDINPKHLSRIESNANRPSFDIIIKLANALDIPLISLFVDDKDKNKDDAVGNIKYMLSELNREQQKHVINIIVNLIKEVKKIAK